jgi:hypothetical protein
MQPIMGFLQDTSRKIFFWTYPRTSWQWDVLCVLILVFIFLTPKSWFENTAFQRTHAGQMTVVLSADVAGAQPDKAAIGKQATRASGKANAQVVAVRERRDPNGKLIAYEVDIR